MFRKYVTDRKTMIRISCAALAIANLSSLFLRHWETARPDAVDGLRGFLFCTAIALSLWAIRVPCRPHRES